MMYRARVEAVSGLKVRAGGKWLTCIGNRVVRAGDMVWTDGRCVYGHDREAQTPLVIVNPKKEDTAIPMLFYDGKDYNFNERYCTFSVNSSKLQEDYVLNQKSRLNERYLINDAYSKVYVSPFLITASSDATSTTATYTIAMNIDKAGNVYEIRRKLREYAYTRYFSAYTYLTDYNDELTVYILKNGQIVREINLTSEIEKQKSDAENFATSHTIGGTVIKPSLTYKEGVYSPYVETIQISVKIRWGVIENASDWAIMLQLERYVEAHAFSEIDNYKGAALYDHSCWVHSHQEFIITPQTTFKIYNRFHSTKFFYGITGWMVVSLNPGEGPLHEWETGTLQDTTETFPYKEPLPIQDGYCFQINDTAELPDYVGITLLDPSGTKLWNGKIIYGTYLTTYKGLLLGVDDSGRASGLANADIKSGLYLIQDGQLTQLVGGYLKNQKLRPMKKYKHWWERIQTVDEGGEENE